MPESTEAKLPLRRPKNLLRRRNVWGFAALGIGLPLAWMLWRIFGWLPALEVTTETTWLTQPVGENGYVDYLGHLRTEYVRQGGFADPGDPWHIMIEDERRGQTSVDGVLYVDPVQEFRASLDAETEMFEREQQVENFEEELLPALTSGPWQADDHPVVAATVEQNAEWYQKLEECRSPVSYLTFPDGTGEPVENIAGYIGLVGTDSARQIQERFLLRMGLHFGQQNPSSAVTDALFLYRALAREQFCMVQLMQQRRHERRLTLMLIQGLLMSETLDEETLDLVEKLPTNASDLEFSKRLQVERMISLDYMTCMHRARFFTDFQMDQNVPSDVYQWIVARQRAHSIDWNALLRHENAFVDKISSLADGDSWLAAHEGIRRLCEPEGADEAKKKIANVQMWQIFPDTATFSLALQDSHPFIVIGHLATAEILLRRRVVQIAARLSVWKLRHTAFPDRLEQLQTLKGFKPMGQKELIDPFTGKPLNYSAQNDGFEIRSLGRNGKPDSTEYLQLNKSWSRFEDESFEYDLVWRWPAIPTD